jgi:DNA-binding CsgD family transcriptional regulator
MSLRIRLDQMRLSSAAWPREGLDEERVTEFMELYEADGLTALPPISVIERADDYLVADGWHRCQALVNLGIEEALVEIVPSTGRDPLRIAYEIGLRSSATASKPLSRAEKQAAVLHLTVEGGRTDAEIAELVGISRTTVARIRNRASALHTSSGDDRPYRAPTPPEDVGVRLFRAIEQVYETRGLGIGDAVFGDRTGVRIATALRSAHGEEALDRARRYRTWIDAAIAHLADGGDE